MDGWGVQMPRDFAAIYGDGLTWTPENDLLALAERAKASGSPLPTLYLTCGRRSNIGTAYTISRTLMRRCGAQSSDFPCKMLPSRYKNRGGKFLSILLEV